jgi:hypothetical protein
MLFFQFSLSIFVSMVSNDINFNKDALLRNDQDLSLGLADFVVLGKRMSSSNLDPARCAEILRFANLLVRAAELRFDCPCFVDRRLAFRASLDPYGRWFPSCLAAAPMGMGMRRVWGRDGKGRAETRALARFMFCAITPGARVRAPSTSPRFSATSMGCNQ